MLRQGTDWKPTCQFDTDAARISGKYNIKVRVLDLTDYESILSVLDEVRPHRIVNLGAQSRPDFSWSRPVETINANVNGTVNLLNACHELGLGARILLASTSAQYGESFEDNAMNALIDENVHQRPINPYGVSKAAAERIAKLLASHYQLDVRYARIFNTSGYGKIGDVISDFSKRIVETNKKEIVVGNLAPLRCFLHVADTLDGLKAILDKGEPGEAYNICSSHEYSVREILDLVAKIADKNVEPKIDQKLLRPTDEPRIKGSSQKLKNLGWTEKRNIEDIIADCIRFHLENKV